MTISKFCTECGAAFDRIVKYCAYCGTMVESVGDSPPLKPTSRPPFGLLRKPGRKNVIIAIASTLGAIALTLGLFPSAIFGLGQAGAADSVAYSAEPQVIERWQCALTSSEEEWVFYRDGTYTSVSPFSDTAGTWEISNDGNALTIATTASRIDGGEFVPTDDWMQFELFDHTANSVRMDLRYIRDVDGGIMDMWADTQELRDVMGRQHPLFGLTRVQARNQTASTCARELITDGLFQRVSEYNLVAQQQLDVESDTQEPENQNQLVGSWSMQVVSQDGVFYRGQMVLDADGTFSSTMFDQGWLEYSRSNSGNWFIDDSDFIHFVDEWGAIHDPLRIASVTSSQIIIPLGGDDDYWDWGREPGWGYEIWHAIGPNCQPTETWFCGLS